MKTSKATLDKIAEFEGIRLKAYKPVKAEKYWTIGVGHYGPDVTKGMTITKERAMELFEQDIKKFEDAVTATGLTLTPNQFDSLVSFAFNCGTGNLQKLVKGRDYQQIADAMLLYNKGSGKVLPGLVRRRQWEHDLFLSDGVPKKTGNPYSMPTKNVRIGSRGNDVRWVQYELTRNGYGIVVDGIFGPKTDKCVRDLQLQHHIQVDGVVGPQTREVLKN